MLATLSVKEHLTERERRDLAWTLYALAIDIDDRENVPQVGALYEIHPGGRTEVYDDVDNDDDVARAGE